MTVDAATPYNHGTSSGWAGSDTSRERALRHDADGTTAHVQELVLTRAANMGFRGVTIEELRTLHPEHHHGTLSGALSCLHKTGRLARLEQKRNRCQIYVVPLYIDGRPVVPHGRANKTTATPLDQEEAEALARLRGDLADGVGGFYVATDPNSLATVIAAVERRTA